MLCSNCRKRQATHTVLCDDGKELRLCDGCYERLGGVAAYLGDGPDFFVKFLSQEKSEARGCPVCGTTLADYTRSGYLGCAACYEQFREELMPTIRKIHGRTQHCGKKPLGSDRLYELMDALKELRAEQEQALREKRMKDAERINRDIREISRMINEAGGEDE